MNKRRKIYLSAHPADRYLYSDKICAALLELSDYEVSYTEVPDDTKCDLPQDAEKPYKKELDTSFTWIAL